MSSFFPPLSLNCPSIKFHHLYPIFPNLPCCPQNATFQLRVHVGYLVAEATQCRYFVGTGSPLPGRRRPTAAVVLPSAATGCLSSTAGHATSTSCESFYFQSSFPPSISGKILRTSRVDSGRRSMGFGEGQMFVRPLVPSSSLRLSEASLLRE